MESLPLRWAIPVPRATTQPATPSAPRLDACSPFLRFELAKLATSIQAVQSLVDELIPRHMAGEELVKEVSMAKYAATEVQFNVADRCLQLFGGYGYMEEYPVSRHFVDARVQRIYGGANEVMLELIARKL